MCFYDKFKIKYTFLILLCLIYNFKLFLGFLGLSKVTILFIIESGVASSYLFVATCIWFIWSSILKTNAYHLFDLENKEIPSSLDL